MPPWEAVIESGATPSEEVCGLLEYEAILEWQLSDAERFLVEARPRRVLLGRSRRIDGTAER